MRLMVGVALLASVLCAEDLPKFMGRTVTVTDPGTDDDGFVPQGPASVCVEGPPERQCFTMPKEYGKAPGVEVIELKKGMPALLFSAASGGVSGVEIHFALLRPGRGEELEDILGINISNQSQRAFWNDPTISDAPICVIADYVWGPDESHYSDHRYTISAYVLMAPTLGPLNYYLDDQYLTVRKYGDPEEGKVDILGAEKSEILARLRRVKAERERKK